jgi:hypothetical protein
MTQRHALKSQAAIAGMLGMLPCTFLDVMQRYECCKETARRVLANLHRVGVIHISDFRRCKDAGNGYRIVAAVYSLGAGPDVPWPADYRHPMRYRVSQTVNGVRTLLEVLQESPRSMAELVEETGMQRKAITGIVQALRGAGIVRIADWARVRDFTAWHPIYGMGSRDKPKPKPLTDSELYARNTARRRAKTQQIRLMQMMSGRLAANDTQQEAA